MNIAEVRHLDGIKGGMAVSESEYVATGILMEKGPVPRLIYSNVAEMAAQQRYVFQTMWAKARPAAERIAGIQNGREPEYLESLRDSAEARDIFLSMIMTARQEVLLTLPNCRALEQQKLLSTIDVLKKKSDASVSVRVICPMDEQNAGLADSLAGRQISLLAGSDSTNTISVIDGAKFFQAEFANADAGTLEDPIGLVVYANRAQSVNTFKSLFEMHWKELSLIRRLKGHDEEKDEFISVAAHELRNPIMPILFVIDSLREGLGDREEIDRLLRNTKRLQLLISNFLEASRIDNHNLRLDRADFDLPSVISEAIEDAKAYMAEKNLRIAYNQEPLPQLHADRGRMTEVIHNLLQNAIKFTPVGGQISVSAKSEGGNIVVRVSDHGSGIDSEIMPKLFRKFATKSDMGNGLGLYLCKAIVEAHGGKIYGENNRDAGATFWFSMPARM